MKAHKITVLVVDFDGLGSEEVKSVIENAHYPNRCISPDVMEIQTVDLGEWTDEHPLNQNTSKLAEYVRLFSDRPRTCATCSNLRKAKDWMETTVCLAVPGVDWYKLPEEFGCNYHKFLRSDSQGE